METKVITFRCPPELLQLVDETAQTLKRSRSTMLLAAIRLLRRQMEENNGFNIPPEALLEDKERFPRPESKGGRPRKNAPKP